MDLGCRGKLRAASGILLALRVVLVSHAGFFKISWCGDRGQFYAAGVVSAVIQFQREEGDEDRA